MSEFETTYEFDAMISVMAESDSKEEAADKIIGHCIDVDIAISLHEEGALNVRRLSSEAAVMRDALKEIWADTPGIQWRRWYPEALELITDAEVEAHYSDIGGTQAK